MEYIIKPLSELKETTEEGNNPREVVKKSLQPRYNLEGKEWTEPENGLRFKVENENGKSWTIEIVEVKTIYE